MHDLAGIAHENQTAALRHNALDIAEALANCVAAHHGALRADVIFDIARLLPRVAEHLPDGHPDKEAAQRLYKLAFAGELPAAPVKAAYVPTSVYTPLEAN